MNELTIGSEGKLSEKIAEKAGVKLNECYQCGKCSAGCPMAGSMDFQPSQIVRLLQLGLGKKLLESRAIWLCASCHMCVDRCPNSIDLPALIENARYEALNAGICAVPEAKTFNTIFVENIRRFGKSQEAILEGAYNLTTGKLLQDMNYAPHMVLHGVVKPTVETVADRAKLREIVERAGKEDEKC